jgi:2-desacetyl-2-hydroxyethyl bacteriochlorophyllide A dehydrogenase
MELTASRVVFTDKCQLRLEEFSPDPLGPEQVLVENEYSMISPGTELAIYMKTHVNFTDPTATWPRYPYRPGYSSVGRVVATGANVKTPKVGDRVVHRLPHASHAAVDTVKQTCLPVEDRIDPKHALFFTFGSISATAVYVRHLPLENVLVLGAGIIGNMAGQLFKAHGTPKLLLTDISPARLAIANRCGIPNTINMKTENLAGSVSRLTDQKGVSIVVEATGVPSLVVTALETVNRLGEVILLGSTRGVVELNVYKLIHAKSTLLTGAHAGTFPEKQTPGIPTWRDGTAQETLDLIATGRMTCAPLITHVISPSQFAEAYDGLAHKQEQYLGVVVDWKKPR